MPRAYLQKSGKWRIFTKIDGKQYSGTFLTEEDAHLWVEMLKQSKTGKSAKSQIRRLGAIVNRNELVEDLMPNINKQLREVDKMTGVEFENFCRLLLKNTGLFVGAGITNTDLNQDYGADLIIDCDDASRVVIQCKRLASTVGIEAVQEVVGALDYYSANVTAVITNNRFSKSAIQLAKRTGTILIDRQKLAAAIEIANRNILKVLNNNQWQLFEAAVESELETNKKLQELY